MWKKMVSGHKQKILQTSRKTRVCSTIESQTNEVPLLVQWKLVWWSKRQFGIERDDSETTRENLEWHGKKETQNLAPRHKPDDVWLPTFWFPTTKTASIVWVESTVTHLPNQRRRAFVVTKVAYANAHAVVVSILVGLEWQIQWKDRDESTTTTRNKIHDEHRSQ